MKTLLKTIISGEDKIYVYEAGYVDGVKAAEAYLAGPDGWGASLSLIHIYAADEHRRGVVGGRRGL